jgi:hypothetical protein
MIDHAVMVVIVLAIMLLSGNMTALHVLGMLQAGPLAPRHHAIGLGPGFHVFDMLLATFQSIRLALGQTARRDALIDALLLIRLTLIDARRIGLSESQYRQKRDKDYDCFGLLHDFLLDDGSIP